MNWEEAEAEYVRYLEQEVGRKEAEIEALKAKVAQLGRLRTVLEERVGEFEIH